jgi:hypothetical protein
VRHPFENKRAIDDVAGVVHDALVDVSHVCPSQSRVWLLSEPLVEVGPLVLELALRLLELVQANTSCSVVGHVLRRCRAVRCEAVG